jgi:eukaryotic-like serine/threonine-protein kinase
MHGEPSYLQPGHIIDRYELLLPVDEDPPHRIWAARLRGTRGFEKLVAMKVLATDPEMHAQGRPLWHEARLASRIQHPNIAQYFDLVEHAGTLCLTMEWIDGESLSSLLRQALRDGGLPIGVALQIVLQTCRGLQGAHELCDADGNPLGPVHCDVSPEDLMISAAGNVKLLDFGIATVRSVTGSSLTPRKLSFMAPEKVMGAPVDTRADIFSLGILLYLLTTGRHPFEAADPAATVRLIRGNAPVTPPSAFVAGYPIGLQRVVRRALAHEPDARYPSASDMLYDLAAAFPGYASKAELAEFLRQTCGGSLVNRRALVSDAFERPPTAAPSVHALASDFPTEPTPTSLSPSALASRPARARSSRFGALRLALGAAALAFVGAFVGTFASPPAKVGSDTTTSAGPTLAEFDAHPQAAAEKPPVGTTRGAEPVGSAPTVPPRASSAPLAAGDDPLRAVHIVPTGPSAASPARRGKAPSAPAKRLKQEPRDRYGI